MFSCGPGFFNSSAPVIAYRSNLQFEGANGSTTITDATGKTWTAYGHAQITTAKYTQGASSLYLDGTSNTCIKSNSYTDFGYGTGDFKVTFDMWPVGNNKTFLSFNGSGQYIAFYISGSNNVVIYNGSTSYPSGASIGLGTWIAMEVGRVSGVVYIKANGTSMVSATVAGSMGTTKAIYLGSDSSGTGGFNGYFDNFLVWP